MAKTTLMEFPCSFSVKIIGMNTPTFLEDIRNVTIKHFPNFKDEELRQNKSQNNNYLAATVTVLAQNQEMLDAFYQEITKIPQVKMVL